MRLRHALRQARAAPTSCRWPQCQFEPAHVPPMTDVDVDVNTHLRPPIISTSTSVTRQNNASHNSLLPPAHDAPRSSWKDCIIITDSDLSRSLALSRSITAPINNTFHRTPSDLGPLRRWGCVVLSSVYSVEIAIPPQAYMARGLLQTNGLR